MHTTLNLNFKKANSSPIEKSRTNELAQLLYKSMGYEEALEQARRSHWDDVADSIHFIAGQTVRRF